MDFKGDASSMELELAVLKDGGVARFWEWRVQLPCGSLV